MSVERDLAQAKHDRQRGAMPSDVQVRHDGDHLWAAFRRLHITSWTSRDVQNFIDGWDACKSYIRRSL